VGFEAGWAVRRLSLDEGVQHLGVRPRVVVESTVHQRRSVGRQRPGRAGRTFLGSEGEGNERDREQHGCGSMDHVVDAMRR